MDGTFIMKVCITSGWVYFLPTFKVMYPSNIFSRSEVPTAEENKFRDSLTYLEMHKFMELHEMHL